MNFRPVSPPEHTPETLAMKGLVTFHAGKREDGLDLIRKGIRFDLTSHIVWHVFGLAKKAEKDYEEAVKSYQQALRYDKVIACRQIGHFV
jgi:tetratricopeptide (TPR) repeat protein